MNRLITITILALVIPIALIAQIGWTEYAITDNFGNASSVFAIDLDDDNDVDILGTAAGEGSISWWENDGSNPPNFSENTVCSTFEGAYSVYAIDLDDDNDVDVLGAAAYDSSITWWENDGGSPPTFAEHIIDSLFDGAKSVYAIDLNGDSAVDVLGAAWYAGDILWWENDGSSPPNFSENTVCSTFDGVSSVYAIDLDGDSDIDVLGAAYDESHINWWENDGSNPPNFTKNTIAYDFPGAFSVYAIDLDGDSDIDVLGAAQIANDITWWENDGNENFFKRTIDSLFNGASSVFAIDLDDDNDVDVLGAANSADDITWWENDGSNPPNFTKNTIADNFNGAYSVYAISLDGDNDIDVLGAAQIASDITWWKNDIGDIHDVGTISIDIPSTLPPDTTLYPKATVKNFGKETESFIVTCKIDPGDYFSTFGIDNLEPDSSKQVTFSKEFTFTSGTYTVTVYTKCPYSEDENPANDTLVKVIQTTGIAEDGSVTPTSFSVGLKSNPIRGKVIFNLALPEDALLTLEIFDASGRLVDIPLKGIKSSGKHTITWTPQTNAGIYFYSLKSTWGRKTGKILFVR